MVDIFDLECVLVEWKECEGMDKVLLYILEGNGVIKCWIFYGNLWFDEERYWDYFLYCWLV